MAASCLENPRGYIVFHDSGFSRQLIWSYIRGIGIGPISENLNELFIFLIHYHFVLIKLKKSRKRRMIFQNFYDNFVGRKNELLLDGKVK